MSQERHADCKEQCQSGVCFNDWPCAALAAERRRNSEIARLTAERDAAIRERDEARRERDEAEGKQSCACLWPEYHDPSIEPTQECLYHKRMRRKLARLEAAVQEAIDEIIVTDTTDSAAICVHGILSRALEEEP